jgi:hypothetical protein
MYIEYVFESGKFSATLTLQGPSWASIRMGFLRAGCCMGTVSTGSEDGDAVAERDGGTSSRAAAAAAASSSTCI